MWIDIFFWPLHPHQYFQCSPNWKWCGQHWIESTTTKTTTHTSGIWRLSKPAVTLTEPSLKKQKQPKHQIKRKSRPHWKTIILSSHTRLECLCRAFSRIKLKVLFKAVNMFSLSLLYLRDHAGKHDWGGIHPYINESKHHMHKHRRQNRANCSNALHSFTKHQICTSSNIPVNELIPNNDWHSDKVVVNYFGSNTWQNSLTTRLVFRRLGPYH